MTCEPSEAYEGTGLCDFTLGGSRHYNALFSHASSVGFSADVRFEMYSKGKPLDLVMGDLNAHADGITAANRVTQLEMLIAEKPAGFETEFGSVVRHTYKL